MTEPTHDPRQMSREQMRELGYWVVDQVVEHFETGGDGPAMRTGDVEGLRAALGGPLPAGPSDPREGLQALRDVALSHMQHGDHPRFFARIPGPSSYAGVLGEWLSIGFNAIASSWGGASGPATVELVALDWLREAIGLPEGTEGVLVSGGSIANISAIAAARANRGPGVAYLTDQTHSSIPRGLAALGFTGLDVHTLTSDPDLRMRVDALERAVHEDRHAGRTPRFVIATAGTTNVGAVDPLPELAALCRREDMWLHVDGAYGAAAAVCDRGREALKGLELADSLVLDAHKWLFAPYGIGCLFVRPGVLDAAFTMDPEYLVDVKARTGQVELRNRTLELTRRGRAFKLWLLLRTHGLDAIGRAVSRGIELAERAEALITADPRLEVVTPAQLAIVTFAVVGADDSEHRARVDRLAADGYAAVTSTTLQGRSVLRLCTINPATTEADLAGTLERLAQPSPA